MSDCMDCSNCPLSKFTIGDRPVSTRKQEKMTSELRFVLSHPSPSFIPISSDNPIGCPTTILINRFVTVPYDIAFTKYCLQANRLEDIKGKTAMEREARACCAPALAEDLVGAKVIVACGNEALAALGYDLKAGNCVGWVDYNEELGASVLACLDPHKVEENSDGLAKDWVWTVQRAQQIIQGFVPDRNITPEPDWVLADTKEKLAELTADYPSDEFMVLDIESTGLDPREDRLLQLGIYNPASKPIIIPRESLLDQDFIEELIKLLDRVKVVAHNGKFDAKFTEEEFGISLKLGGDTLVFHHMLDERTGTHGLKRLVRVYLNWGFYDDAIGDYYKMEDGLANAPFEEVADYLSLDLLGTWGVLQQELLLLRDDRESTKYPWKIQLSQRDHVEKILNPVNNELKRVEQVGFLVDEARLDELIAEAEPSVAAKKAEIEDFLFDELGEEFSVDSPIQLLKALHGIGALKEEIQTTAYKVLKDYVHIPIVKEILEYKKECKILNAFYISIKNKLVVSKWGKKVFATFNLAGTIGSRWSGSNPNLQQAPRAPHPFKSIFIPNEGHVIFQNDFSALEVCIAAYLSRDKALAEAFKGDMHTTVSKSAFKKYFDEMEEVDTTEAMWKFIDKHPLMMSAKKSIEKMEQNDGAFGLEKLKKEITKHLRYCAKVITFGIFYGRGARALAEQELSCSEADAREFICNYYKLFPDLEKFIKKVHYIVKDIGLVVGPAGRVRDVRSWRFSGDQRMRDRAFGRACRQIINFLMQDHSGVINNIAFAKGANFLTENNCGAMLAAVHDSSVGEIWFDENTSARLDAITRLQEGILVDDLVSLGVDPEVGFNWGELYPQKVFFDGCGMAVKIGLKRLGVDAVKERLALYVRKLELDKMTEEEKVKEGLDLNELTEINNKIKEIDEAWELMI